MQGLEVEEEKGNYKHKHVKLKKEKNLHSMLSGMGKEFRCCVGTTHTSPSSRFHCAMPYARKRKPRANTTKKTQLTLSHNDLALSQLQHTGTRHEGNEKPYQVSN